MAKSFLFVLIGNRSKASSRVRGYWIAEELRVSGHTVKIVCPKSRVELLFIAFRVIMYNAIIFQKRYSKYDIYIAKLSKALGVKTFLDIDDAPSLTNNVTTLQNFRRMALTCTHVLAGSKVLFQYVMERSSNAIYFPTSVDLKSYNYPSKSNNNNMVTLGWIGNGAHYREDLLQILVPVLTKLMNNVTFKLKIIGSSDDERLKEGFGRISNLQIEFVDQLNWGDPKQVFAALDDIDIGLYPLLPSDHNSFKCGFKALEYMACSKPVVSSKVGITDEIIEHGISGFIVKSTDDWINALSKLIADFGLRNEMGANGRARVEHLYNVISRAHELEEKTK